MKQIAHRVGTWMGLVTLALAGCSSGGDSNAPLADSVALRELTQPEFKTLCEEQFETKLRPPSALRFSCITSWVKSVGLSSASDRAACEAYVDDCVADAGPPERTDFNCSSDAQYDFTIGKMQDCSPDVTVGDVRECTWESENLLDEADALFNCGTITAPDADRTTLSLAALEKLTEDRPACQRIECAN